MSNTQYMSQPLTDWSSEISAPQPSAHAQTTTSTTTTTTASASSGCHGGSAPVTTTTTNTNASAAQQPQSYPSPAMQRSQSVPGPAAQSQAVPAPAAQPQSPSAPAAQPQPALSGGVPSAHNEFQGASGTLDLETHQPIEVIEAPTSMNEAFLGSMKSMLLRNRGSFVTATFLIGTQGTTTWEGILHDVGNDHIIIFQPGRQRYIACDIYALKYIEFYDTRERDACAQLLRQSGLNSDMNRGMNNFY